MHKVLKLSFLMYLFFANMQANVDFVAFSYNRPMQLYALLESVECFMTGLGIKTIIYRADTKRYDSAYEKVKKRFNSYIFCKQGANPKQDFKPLTIKATFETPADYVIFAVDDNIVKGNVDLASCTQLMKETHAYAFMLRLGKNITRSYMLNKPLILPKLTSVTPDVFQWDVPGSRASWGYIHSVDLSVYKKSDIKKSLEKLQFRQPNSLESEWSYYVPKNCTALCYGSSKIFGLPINIVNQSTNRHMGLYSTSELLEKFEQGLKIDISPMKEIQHSTPHIAYSPKFVLRGEK